MKAFQVWGMALVLLISIGASMSAWWSLDLRWRPKTIREHESRIAAVLERSGWVSPGLTGPKLYMVAPANCAACTRFSSAHFADLQAKGVDTRIIAVASLPGGRAPDAKEADTIAELWVNRSWDLYRAWVREGQAWEAEGVPPSEGDAARQAVLAASQRTVTDLARDLRANGVEFDYPVLVWWTRDGKMKACACTRPQTDRRVLRDFGLKS